MRKSVFLFLFALSVTCAAPDSSVAADMTVMTYNIRYASDTPPNAWPDRRELLVQNIRNQSPDVFGTQEALYRQVKDILAALPEYDWIGLGRDGGSRGEFMAVFYKRDRLEPIEYDHFWLSDTPDRMASTTWGNTNRRMVTWVKFRDRESKQEFYFWNTHFDHLLQPAREKSADLILKRLSEIPADAPVVLVGDFNAAAEKNKAYEILVNPEGLRDTWKEAAERKNEGIATFNGFKKIGEGARIDWILVRGPVKALSSEIVTFAPDGKFPSDHLPVVAKLKIGEGN